MAISFETGQEEATGSSYICNTSLSNAIVARGTMGFFLVWIDLCLLISMLIYKNSQRYNIINSYVASSLLASLIYSLLFVIDLLEKMANASNCQWTFLQSYIEDPSKTRLPVLKRTSVPVMLLIMNLNATLLIYCLGLRASVGPFSTLPKRDSTLKNNLKIEKIKAMVLISASWLLPIIFAIFSTMNWSCITYCEKIPLHYDDDEVSCDPDDESSSCSRYWSPISQSFLFVICAFSAAGNVIMFYMLFTNIRNFGNFVSREEESHTGEWKRDFSSIYELLKLSIVVAALSFISFFPFLALLMVDILLKFAFDQITLQSILIITMFYSTVLPFALIIHMPGLRMALKSVLTKLCPRLAVVIAPDSNDSDINSHNVVSETMEEIRERGNSMIRRMPNSSRRKSWDKYGDYISPTRQVQTQEESTNTANSEPTEVAELLQDRNSQREVSQNRVSQSGIYDEVQERSPI